MTIHHIMLGGGGNWRLVGWFFGPPSIAVCLGSWDAGWHRAVGGCAGVMCLIEAPLVST